MPDPLQDADADMKYETVPFAAQFYYINYFESIIIWSWNLMLS